MRTLLSAATSARTSGTFSGPGEFVLTARGTLGAGSAVIQVSHGGANWVAAGSTLDASNPSQIVTLMEGMHGRVNYTPGSSSPQASWTIEASGPGC